MLKNDGGDVNENRDLFKENESHIIKNWGDDVGENRHTGTPLFTVVKLIIVKILMKFWVLNV